MIQDRMLYSPRKDHQHHKWRPQKVMDITSRLPGCARQAADAISAYTQVKNGRCSIVVRYSKIRMSRYLDTYTNAQMAKIMVQYGRPSRSSWAESVPVILWQDYYGKGNVRKSYWSMAGRKVPNWECLFVHRQQGSSLSAYVDDLQLAGKKQNINPT